MTASPTFKELLADAQSPTAPETRRVLELDDDDAEAVDAMVRYLYSFEYADILRCREAPATLWFHLSVYDVALKYQIAKLEEKAIEALSVALSDVRVVAPGAHPDGDVRVSQGVVTEHVAALTPEAVRTGYTPGRLFDLVKQLNVRQALDQRFDEWRDTLVRLHLATLMELREFRGCLEEEESERMLSCVLQALKVADPNRRIELVCEDCKAARAVGNDARGRGYMGLGRRPEAEGAMAVPENPLRCSYRRADGGPGQRWLQMPAGEGGVVWSH
ncbi:hypothetical protein LTR09_002936 [Extremus antarcticus]|uniref:BTB domain-containing protein n=1 Tax=Extremus antarcticus TaxID=702011 RepID=A0AAJ0GFD7_9PEZI|nr:hypothetical protein LTR09_002936 [Extremus antarcticus]